METSRDRRSRGPARSSILAVLAGSERVSRHVRRLRSPQGEDAAVPDELDPDTPEAFKIAESVRNVRGWADALTREPTPLSLLARLDLPVLLMSGDASPVSSLGVTRLLAGAMPRVRTISFEGVGHMGPLTHSDLVNAAIARFLHTLDQQEESTP